MSWYSIVRRGGTGAAWTPGQLGSTSIWVDIDSLGLSNGSGITTLTDRSGNSHDLTDPNSGSDHATVVSDDLNGLDVADFQKTGGYTLDNWVGPFGNDGVVHALVAEIASVSSNEYLSELRVGGVQLMPLLYRTNQTLTPTNQRRSVSDADVDITGSVPDTTGWAAIVLAHDYATGGIDVRVNGTSVATGTLASTGAGPENDISVGLGSSTLNAAPMSLKLAEALWFDDRLTTGATGDLERVEGYLAHRYALQSKLPAGHPYKTTAPTA